MERFPFYILSIVLCLCLFYQLSHSQQTYLNNLQLNCMDNPSISKGYLCNGLLKSCKSYVTFRSQPSYDTSISIAYLLGSDASSIASINNISTVNQTIPSDKLIIVPISCSCSGSIYQHYAPYTAKKLDSYFLIANNTYQGLTTCQAMIGQNYYDHLHVQPATELMVPVICARPRENQTVSGVTSLLAYMVTSGDSISSIAMVFGVNEQSILEANKLSQDSIIFPFTPLLIPLGSKTCTTDPGRFFCDCPNGYLADGVNCKTDSKKFPVKWVTLSGIFSARSLSQNNNNNNNELNFGCSVRQYLS